ncbi:MAG: hypothetical protein IK102_08295 [Treponema sp.]|nr:hypothetical protein [Treponema sp.]
MPKYKFTEEEKESLKVAKLNQDKSQALQSEMDNLKKSWTESNNKDEEFLSSVEKKLGITDPVKIDKKAAFTRESKHVEEIDWFDLIAEAEEEYHDDISFEDLLNQEKFSKVYAKVKEIDKEFEKKTGIREKDFAFLGIAIALQCVRQYVLDPLLKKNRKGASANDEKGRKGKAEPGWYYVETDKILNNSVPFDVQQYGDNSTIDGFLMGGDHRAMTLGHDPVLGWIFGTANIMTSTVTRRDFVSAHVKCINNTNKIYALANTLVMFKKIFERVFAKGIDGKLALAAALGREFIHLKSDIFTKRSLPIPGISAISPELCNKLAKYGIDTASVGTEVSLSCFINTIISMIHRLCFDETKDNEQFYQIRTRKIILYSNFLASTSNIIASVLTKKYELLDVGGILVTIGRLITDVRFICKVKDEFVQSKLDEQFEGIKSEIDNLYNSRFLQSRR